MTPPNAKPTPVGSAIASSLSRSSRNRSLLCCIRQRSCARCLTHGSIRIFEVTNGLPFLRSVTHPVMIRPGSTLTMLLVVDGGVAGVLLAPARVAWPGVCLAEEEEEFVDIDGEEFDKLGL